MGIGASNPKPDGLKRPAPPPAPPPGPPARFITEGVRIHTHEENIEIQNGGGSGEAGNASDGDAPEKYQQEDMA